ncbi:MAG: cupin domain-containing protein [Gammaproteobacteria bacterium]
MKTSISELLKMMPGARSAQWPDGEPYAVGFSHGSMSLGFYAPVGADPQQPHQQDELYIVQTGHGTIFIGDQRTAFSPGDAFFVPAGVEHRFEDFSDDFHTWVVFWGPAGGETESGS